MKKVTALVLALIMILAISACGNQTGSSSNDDNQTTADAAPSAETGKAEASSGDYFVWDTFDESRINGLTELGQKQKNLVIPAKCTTLGQLTYFDENSELIKNTVLETVSFENEDTVLEYATFNGCTKLYQINLPSNIAEIPDYCFNNCKSLETITFPENVTRVGSNAFAGCKSLKEVKLNEGLENIGRRSFAECESLTNIEIPASVKEIQKNAFGECFALKEVLFHDGLEKVCNYAFDNCDAIKELRFPDTLVAIEDASFPNMDGIEAIYLPEGCTEIEYGAFDMLNGITIYVKEGSFADLNFDSDVNYASMHTKAYY